MREPSQVLVHFYRASVMHADVWRQRLDATTNWAVVTTAAMITFAFGEAAAPHYVLLMAMVFALFFLLMESRRYQTYHMWQQRVRALNRYLVAPALAPDVFSEDEVEGGLEWISRDLSSTLPRITVYQAAGYRIRRNYGPLITIGVLAWGLKLWAWPEPADAAGDLVERAHVGFVPGSLVMLGVVLFFAALVVAAVQAPSEHLEDWEEVRTPLGSLLKGEFLRRRRRRREVRRGSPFRPPARKPEE